jgi:predicted DNA-binding transcriptional regulator AlpA
MVADMIPIDKKLTDLTWGEIVADLDERYGKRTVVAKQQYLNPDMEPLLNVKQCAALTGYVEGYIRQLVFKREIPYNKNPNRKPVRFKRSEILEWMATKKFTPIDELAENYIAGNSITRK